MYRGPLVAFLHELAGDGEFKELLRLDDVRLRDGTLEETVLKFFAYKHASADYRGPIKPFLNSFMKNHKDVFPADSYREEFMAAVKLLRSVLKGPYLRAGYHSTPMVPFEAALLAAARVAESGNAAAPKKGWKEDKILRSVSGGGHNTPGKLRERVDRLVALLEGAAPKTR